MSQLDTPAGCVAELTSCNKSIAEIGHKWAEDAGNLSRELKRYERLYKEALKLVEGPNAEVRMALAHECVEKVDEGISERIEQLTGEVERCKTLFRGYERRSSNAQSVLALHRDEAKLGEYVA